MSGVETLLDTNAVIAWNRGDQGIKRLLMTFAEVGIPLFVAGELHFGAINSARRDHNLLLLDKAVAKFPVIFPDAATIPIYASIRHGLRVKGRPIPENDVWIAALAGRHDIPVITRDAHFQSIDGVRLETW